jgi:hypothetical protein
VPLLSHLRSQRTLVPRSLRRPAPSSETVYLVHIMSYVLALFDLVVYWARRGEATSPAQPSPARSTQSAQSPGFKPLTYCVGQLRLLRFWVGPASKEWALSRIVRFIRASKKSGVSKV